MVDNRGHDVPWPAAASDSESNDSDIESDNDDLVCDGAGGREDDRYPDISQFVQEAIAMADIKNQKENSQEFSNIAIMSSQDVHLGNKLVYNGPVVINNYLRSGSEDVSVEETSKKEPPSASLEKSTSRKESQPCNEPQYNSQSSPGTELGPTGEASGRGLVASWCQELTQSRTFVLGAAASTMSFAVLLGILLVLVVNKKSTEHTTSSPSESITPFTPPQENTSGNLTIVKRNEWRAIPSSSWKIENLIHPVECVVISHTASEICTTFDECANRARIIQRSHMEIRGWPDFGYNFLVGGDGYVYEGRGWNKEPAHPFQKIRNHISINLIGLFDKEPAPDQQILAARQLIEEGVRLMKVATNYDLLGLRQLANTISPGEELFKQIQTWAHWTSSSPCMATIKE